MKRSILNGLLVLTALLFLMYAFVLKAEADKLRILSEQQRELAERNIQQCDRQRAIAEEQVRLLEKQLKEKAEDAAH